MGATALTELTGATEPARAGLESSASVHRGYRCVGRNVRRPMISSVNPMTLQSGTALPRSEAASRGMVTFCPGRRAPATATGTAFIAVAGRRR
jgi:hypothetical protein